MRFNRFLKPLVAALLITVAASSVGCSAGGPTDAASIGTQAQAASAAPPTDWGKTAGAAGAGVNAAMNIGSMISNYAKYGKAILTTGEVLNEVERTQAQVDALGTALTTIDSKVFRLEMDQTNLVAVDIENNANRLVSSWGRIQKSGTTAETAFLATVPQGAIEGSLRWSDLTTLNDVMVGRDGTTGLIQMNGFMQGKSANPAESDALGMWMANKMLVQQKAFLLLAAASANDPSVDLAAEAKAQQARMDQQELSFLAATRSMNKSLPDATRQVLESKQTVYAALSLVGTWTSPDGATWKATAVDNYNIRFTGSSGQSVDMVLTEGFAQIARAEDASAKMTLTKTPEGMVTSMTGSVLSGATAWTLDPTLRN
jgi:hypothetical protein